MMLKLADRWQHRRRMIQNMADNTNDGLIEKDTLLAASTQESSVDSMQMCLGDEVIKSSQDEITSTEVETGSDSETNFVDNCYCGKKRNLGTVELQCTNCLKWFHDKCIKDCPSFSSTNYISFATNYSFSCQRCSPTDTEVFILKQSNFSQMCITAIANLMHRHRDKDRTTFSKNGEIIRFIEKKWENLTSMPRRIKQTWHATVHKNLKDESIFLGEEKPTSSCETSAFFGLVYQDLFKIGPNYEPLLKGGSKDSSIGISSQGNVGNVPKSRGAKRKGLGENQYLASTKKPKSDLIMPKLPPHGYPLEHPFNKDGYRYILAEPDIHAPCRQEFDESHDWAGKPIPGFLYRSLAPPITLLALHDRAPQLKISDDRLSVTGEKGYCTVRATTAVAVGSWYYEITIDDMPADSATRLGWCQPLGNLQAPLGYDSFGYSWRSRKGTCFHQSKGRHYGDGYCQGDVLGFLINLPPESNIQSLPPTYKDMPLVKFKSHLYYEEKDEVQQALKDLKPLPNSSITYFKNGTCLGVAWSDINAGSYYPAASLYKNTTVTFNFGPKFKHAPKTQKFRGMNQATEQNIIHQAMADLLYLVENDGKLQLCSFYM